MRCGCKIRYGSGKGGNQIVFCPLHESAVEMLEALKSIREWLLFAEKIGKGEAGLWLDEFVSANNLTNAAIAKAEPAALSNLTPVEAGSSQRP